MYKYKLNNLIKLPLYTAILMLIGTLSIGTGCGGEDEPGDNGEFTVDDLALSGEILDLDDQGLELENEAGEVISIEAGDNSFLFDTVYSEGASYEVSVAEQPQSQECTLTNASGTFERNDISNLRVQCESIAEFQVMVNSDASDLVAAAGGNIRVVAEITNDAQLEGEQDVQFSIGDNEITTESIILDGGRTTVMTFVWETTTEDIGAHTATVSTGDTSDAIEVTVTDLDYFEVSIDTAASMLSVTGDDIVMVAVEVENNGAQQGTQNIELSVDGTTVDTVQSLGLNDGESITLSLQWMPDAEDRGEFELQVTSDNDSDTATANVVDGAYFDLEVDFAQSLLDVTTGETAEIVAHITNTGEVSATQNIELIVDGDIVDSYNALELAPEATQTITLEWDAADAQPGSLAAQIMSADANTTFVISVLEPAYYGVDIDLFESDLEVTKGAIAQVVANITNFGEVTGQQHIELSIDGEIVDTVEDFTVAPGSVETVTLTWDTNDAGGTYDVMVATDDELDSFSLFVEDECSATTAIGDTCVDGTSYAGDFNGAAYYTTEFNANGGAGLKYAQTSSDSGAESMTDGRANTIILSTQTDAGAPYEAADACADLDANGHQDWFLPALDELVATIAQHRALLPNVENVSYWSSTGTPPPNDHSAFGHSMSMGYSFGTSKTSANTVRCVRTN